MVTKKKEKVTDRRVFGNSFFLYYGAYSLYYNVLRS